MMHHEHDHHHAHEDGHEHVGDVRQTPARTMAVVKAALLVGLGVYLLSLVWTEAVGHYVHVRFGWLATVGGLLALLLGTHALARLARSLVPGRGTDALLEAGLHAGHQHQPLSLGTVGFVAIPLALGLLVPAQPLGAAAVTGDIALSQNAGAGGTLVIADSAQWTVADWLRAFTSGGGERLSGKPADISGFVYRQDGDPEGHFVVARFLMVHCTADAYAVGLPVRWAGTGALPADTWVRVQGTVQIGDFRGNRLPILVASSVDDRVERPKQAYLYQ